MKKYTLLLLAMFILTGISCVHEPGHQPDQIPDYEADKQALTKMSSEDWDANVLAGNMEANVEVFAEDALMIRDGMTYSGKEAIRTLLTNEVRPGFSVATCDNKVDEIRVSGDLATVRGNFLGSWAHEEWGDTLWTKAAWMDICERQEDGSWKMVYTMAMELME